MYTSKDFPFQKVLAPYRVVPQQPDLPHSMLSYQEDIAVRWRRLWCCAALLLWNGALFLGNALGFGLPQSGLARTAFFMGMWSCVVALVSNVRRWRTARRQLDTAFFSYLHALEKRTVVFPREPPMPYLRLPETDASSAMYKSNTDFPFDRERGGWVWHEPEYISNAEYMSSFGDWMKHGALRDPHE